MKTLHERVERLMKDYPYGSQSEKSGAEVIIPVKLFMLASGASWWLSEYDPVERIAFGYVTRLIGN